MIWLPGFLSQGGEKYTWERYEVVYDKVAGSPSSFRTTSSTMHYRSTSYTIQNNLFVLTDPARVYGNNLMANHYLVRTGDGRPGSSTSGPTLIEITSRAQDDTDYVLSYTPYTVGVLKGSLIDTVSSKNPTAYPTNGIQDGYWYVRQVQPGEINFVDYIEATGTQWADSGFTPDNNSRIVIDFAATDVSVTNNIVGTRNTTSSKAFTFSTTDGNWRMGYNNSSLATSVAADTDRHTADLNGNVLKLDGTTIYTATAATFTGYASIYVGAIHASGTGYNGYVRIYSCQIYDNGSLVRDYWPCLDPDGVPCLYDKVNAEYVYNAGTGNFAYGMAA